MSTSCKKVYILMVRYPGPMADWMVKHTGFDYTHVTIGLEEDLNTFYSFFKKGFFIEKITRYRKPGREPFPCILFEVDVSKKEYRRVKKMLLANAARKKFLRYTNRSLVTCFLGIPWKIPDHYFCSEFVAEVIQKTGIAWLPKHCALVLPHDIYKLPELKLIFTGNVYTMAEHYDLKEGRLNPAR